MTLSQDVVYHQSMKTGWKLPARVRKLPEREHEAVRQRFHILVEGTDLPPPVTSFDDLKLPRCLLDELKNKGIKKPTPIQMQVICHTRFSWHVAENPKRVPLSTSSPQSCILRLLGRQH